MAGRRETPEPDEDEAGRDAKEPDYQAVWTTHDRDRERVWRILPLVLVVPAVVGYAAGLLLGQDHPNAVVSALTGVIAAALWFEAVFRPLRFRCPRCGDKFYYPRSTDGGSSPHGARHLGTATRESLPRTIHDAVFVDLPLGYLVERKASLGPPRSDALG